MQANKCVSIADEPMAINVQLALRTANFFYDPFKQFVDKKPLLLANQGLLDQRRRLFDLIAQMAFYLSPLTVTHNKILQLMHFLVSITSVQQAHNGKV